MKIPNIDTGLRITQFEEILRNYVKIRAQEYYKWKDYQYSIQYSDSNYYINRIDDFIDEDGIYRALQYRYTNWAQPENTTIIRQKLIDVFISFYSGVSNQFYFNIYDSFLKAVLRLFLRVLCGRCGQVSDVKMAQRHIYVCVSAPFKESRNPYLDG